MEGARKLLAEAGHGSGLDLTIDVGNTDGPWHQTVCEALRDQLKEAGNQSCDQRAAHAEILGNLGQDGLRGTSWGHRPLGTMVLSQAYRSGVPWNESHYANPEFDKALDAAEATLDVEERKKKLAAAEKILQDDAVMVLPLFRPIYTIVAQKVNGYEGHPTQYHQFNKVWMA